MSAPLRIPGRHCGPRLRHVLAALVLALPVPGAAHISEGRKLQSLMLWPGAQGGVEVLALIPAPFLFGDVIAQAGAPGTPLASRFLKADGAGAYRLSVPPDAAPAFTARARRALDWSAPGAGALPADLLGWALLPPEEPPPTALADGIAATARSDGPEAIDFGDGTVALHLRLAKADPARDLAVRSGHPPLRLPPTTVIETRITDLRGTGARVATHPGALDQPRAIPAPPAARRPAGSASLRVAAIMAALSAALAVLAWRLRPLHARLPPLPKCGPEP